MRWQQKKIKREETVNKAKTDGSHPFNSIRHTKLNVSYSFRVVIVIDGLQGFRITSCKSSYITHTSHTIFASSSLGLIIFQHLKGTSSGCSLPNKSPICRINMLARRYCFSQLRGFSQSAKWSNPQDVQQV